jgi:putative phage-type endonuclease
MDGPLLQRSEAWFSARIGKINASELDKVLGFGYGRDEARQKLFRCLREHIGPEPFSNEATRWGQDHESDALTMYSMHSSFSNNLRVQEHGGRTHEEHSWLRASPDGLLYEGDTLVGVLEIKAPYRLREKDPPMEDSDILTGYLLQMNLQMEVYDVDFCDFVQWTPHGITVRRILRNRALFQYVLPLYEEFYNVAVKTTNFYKRLDPSDVIMTEMRIVKLHADTGAPKSERVLLKDIDTLTPSHSSNFQAPDE